MSELDGRTVVVTGAASGIGRALALGFARDGAKVVGADIAAERLAELAGEGVLPITTDVSDDAQVRAMVAFALAETGRLDVLFNNAGVAELCTIEQTPAGAFERGLGVHLFGTFYGLRAALPVMRTQGYGRIVNTLSRGAEVRRPGWAAYAAAKAGLLALTRVAAAEVAGADILINGMIPGPTRSGMNDAPDLQPPEAVYPSARRLATLPADGPNGRVFWNEREYHLFAERPAGS